MPILVGSRRAALGGAVGFDPRSLGNLALWLDATKLTGLNDGAAVTTWADASGNTGRDATQATGAKQPTYKTGIQNGKPVVRFDGGDCVQTPSVDFSGTSKLSIYVVASSSVSGVYQTLVELGSTVSGVTDAFGIFKSSANVGEINIKGDVGTNVWTTTAGITAMMYLSAVLDKTLSSGEAAGWINGSGAGTQTSNSNNTNAFSNRILNIGARNNAATLPLTGDIAEVLIFTAAHTTTQRQQVEAYLAAKWGL